MKTPLKIEKRGQPKKGNVVFYRRVSPSIYTMLDEFLKKLKV